MYDMDVDKLISLEEKIHSAKTMKSSGVEQQKMEEGGGKLVDEADNVVEVSVWNIHEIDLKFILDVLIKATLNCLGPHKD